MFDKKTQIIFVILAFAFLFNTASAQENTNDEVIKINTSLVNIPVIVSDRNGRNIAGLKVENFNVFQDGEQQKIEYFASEETPINVAILVDTSRSTQDVLGKIKKSAKEFVKQLLPNDKAMIVTFDYEVNVLNDLTSDQKILEKAIKSIEIGRIPGTVLHDAVYEIVNKRFASVKGRKAMILLTDGKDFGSYVNEPELIKYTEESDTLIYSIYYETNDIPLPMRQNPFPGRNRFPNQRRFPDGQQQRRQQERMERVRQRNARQNQEAIEFLRTLSDSTAGRLYQKEMDDLKQTFNSIADELRKQYVIGYYPEKTDSEGKLHQIKVRTDLQNAVVRAKTVYRSQKTQ